MTISYQQKQIRTIIFSTLMHIKFGVIHLFFTLIHTNMPAYPQFNFFLRLDLMHFHTACAER